MPLAATNPGSCKAQSHQQHEFKGLRGGGCEVARIVAGICAAALVVSSAGFGAVFAWQTGSQHGPLLGGLTVLFAVALEGCKPLAVAGTFSAFRALALVRGLALGLLALSAISYSLSSELALMAQSRGDLAAGRANVVEQAATKRDRIRAARSELNSLASSRPVADVEAAIAKLLAANPKAGDCSVMDGPVSRNICPTVMMLKSEAARTERRQELQAIIERSTDSLTTAPAVKAADPGSSALATYLALLGIVVSTDMLGQWLLLVPVLALELGSTFAVVLAQSVSAGTSRGNGRAKSSPIGTGPVTEIVSVVELRSDRLHQGTAARSDNAVDSSSDAVKPAGTGVSLSEASPARTRGRATGTAAGKRKLGHMSAATRGQQSVSTRQAAADRIADELRRQGGKGEGSIRKLAQRIRGSRSTVHAGLATLIATGAVERLGSELVLRNM